MAIVVPGKRAWRHGLSSLVATQAKRFTRVRGYPLRVACACRVPARRNSAILLRPRMSPERKAFHAKVRVELFPRCLANRNRHSRRCCCDDCERRSKDGEQRSSSAHESFAPTLQKAAVSYLCCGVFDAHRVLPRQGSHQHHAGVAVESAYSAVAANMPASNRANGRRDRSLRRGIGVSLEGPGRGRGCGRAAG